MVHDVLVDLLGSDAFAQFVIEYRRFAETDGLAVTPIASLALLVPLVRGEDRIGLLAVGATLYIAPYLIGVQGTQLTGAHLPGIVKALVSSSNPDLALPLCYLSAALVGILGIVAAVYNLRQTNVRKPAAAAVPESTR